MGPQFGSFQKNSPVHVDDPHSPLTDQPHHARQKLQAVDILPLTVPVWKMHTDIAVAHRTQNGICNRVHQCIGVRMTVGAALSLNRDTADYQQPSLNQAMCVMSNPNSEHTSLFN